MTKKSKIEDMDFEIQFYEGIIKKKPDFFAALSALGDLYTKKGEYEKGLELDLRLTQLRPEDPIVLYNLACSYSLINDTNLALRTIKKAINRGYDDFDFIQQDKDLHNLHQDSRFKRYFARIKNKKNVSSGETD